MIEKHNATLNLLLIIASFFVVLGHVPFPNPYGYYLLAIGKFSFPFFFMVYGWFLYREDPEEAEATVIKALISNLKLTLLSVVIVSIFNISISLTLGQHPFDWVMRFVSNRESVLYFLIYNNAKFLNPVMWFFFAYTYVLLVYYLALRLKALKIAYFFIIPSP